MNSTSGTSPGTSLSNPRSSRSSNNTIENHKEGLPSSTYSVSYDPLSKLGNQNQLHHSQDPKLAEIPTRPSDETLRHPEMPLSVSSIKGQTLFLRIYRADGSFGTVAGPLEMSVNDLLHLAARKFFIPDIDRFHLVALLPDKVAVLPLNARPFEFIKNQLTRVGYTERDPWLDICRKNLTSLGKIILTDHPLIPPSESVVSSLHKRPDRVVLRKQDLLTMPSYVAETANRVEVLDISQSMGLHVTEKYWSSLRRIKVFKAERCNFGNLMNVSFLPYLTTLTHLDLSRNALLTLDVDFKKLPHLRALNLRGNNLKELPPSLESVELRLLYLGTNSLTSFPFRITTLLDLDLSYNKLTELPLHLESFHALERLSLANNKIEGIPENLGPLPNLTDLDLRYNHVSDIGALLQPKLHTLNVSHNTRIENKHRNSSMAAATTPTGSPLLGVKPRAHNKLAHLRKIDLSYSRSIRLVPNIQMDSVSVINLECSLLVSVPEELFTCMPNLEIVDLSKNKLSRLPQSIKRLKRLRKLYLSSNSLNILPNDLYFLPQLEVLDLHANNFKTLPQAARELRRLRVLNLSSNLLESLPSFSLHDLDSSSTPSREILSPTSLFPVSSHRSFDSRGMDESRRGSAVSNLSLDPSSTDKHGSPYAEDESTTTLLQASDTFASSFGEPPSLEELYLADNRLGDDCFEELSFCTELRVLNLSYNEITEIPSGTLVHMPHLKELSLSGNRVSTLSQEDFSNARSLKSLYINSNKLHTLPAELSKVTELETLDVACNNLRYNVSNWTFEWNWRWNKRLRLLNLSSNRRLEIMRPPNQRSNEEDYTSFCVLPNLQILGLMDVTLTTSALPDQSENCRVRTYGSDFSFGRFGVADYLADGAALSINDLMIDSFRGNKDEMLAGMFDGFLAENRGNRISKITQELIAPIVKQELERRGKDDTVSDCLRRAFLTAHREIGNASMATKEEVSHSFVGQYSAAAQNLTVQDQETCSGATLVYIKDRSVYIASTGGARVIIAKANGQFAILSEPVKLQSDFSVDMMRTGGGIMCQDLINGKIPHNPVIGAYSEGVLTSAAPNIYEYTLEDTADNVIIASSELWDVMSYETAADLARTEARDPMLAALKLRDFALAYGRDKIKQLMVMVYGRTRVQTDDVREMNITTIDKRRRLALPEDPILARIAETTPPQGEITMVFTDIRHSTVLWEMLPDVMEAANKIHQNMMRRSFRAMGGYEVKMEGDAFIISFHTAVDALLWCLTAQQQLLDIDWPTELLAHPECAPVYSPDGRLLYRGLSVRMGIHCGRAVHELDAVTRRMDYFGPMVNKTARISAAAAGGQIAVSADLLNMLKTECESPTDDEARRQCATLSACGYYVQELGEIKLKGIEMPELIYIIYPGSLKSRSESVMPEAEPLVVSMPPSIPSSPPPPTPSQQRGSSFGTAASLVPVPSTQPAGEAERAPSDLDAAQSVTNRLERICAYIRTGQMSEPLSNETQQALEHYVTRIENSVDSLTLQMLMPEWNGPTAGGLFDENFDSD